MIRLQLHLSAWLSGLGFFTYLFTFFPPTAAEHPVNKSTAFVVADCDQDTLPPTFIAPDSLVIDCLPEARTVAVTSEIDINGITDDQPDNVDYDGIRDTIYERLYPELTEIIKEWRIPDLCGNIAVAQQVIWVPEPIRIVAAPDTVLITSTTQLRDTSLTGSLLPVWSACGNIIEFKFSDSKSQLAACRDTVIRTWNIEDDAGNARVVRQVLIYGETPAVGGLGFEAVNAIEALGAEVSGSTIFVNQEDLEEVFDSENEQSILYILGPNSLIFNNQQCAAYASINFTYTGDRDPDRNSCSAGVFSWKMFDDFGNIIATHNVPVEVTSCLSLLNVDRIHHSSVSDDLILLDDFELMAGLNTDTSQQAINLETRILNLTFEYDFSTCNNDPQQRIHINDYRILFNNEPDSPQQACIAYDVTVEIYDATCNYSDDQQLTILVHDTIPPTAVTPADTYYSCNIAAEAAAGGARLDRSLIQDNILGNEDTTQVTDTIYANRIDGLDALTKRWSIADACGNQSFVYQNFIIDEVPLNFDAPPTAYIYEAEQLNDLQRTGSVAAAVSSCTEIEEIFYTDSAGEVRPCRDTIIRTWTVRDTLGNTASKEQYIIYAERPVPAGLRAEDIAAISMMQASVFSTPFGETVVVNQRDVEQLYHNPDGVSIIDVLSEASVVLANSECAGFASLDFYYLGNEAPTSSSCTAGRFYWNYIDYDGQVLATYVLSVVIETCLTLHAVEGIVPASVPESLQFASDFSLFAAPNGDPIALTTLDTAIAELELSINAETCNENTRTRFLVGERQRTATAGNGPGCAFEYPATFILYDSLCGVSRAQSFVIQVIDTIAPTVHNRPETLSFACLEDAFLAAINSRLPRQDIVDNIIGNVDLNSLTDTIFVDDSFDVPAVTKRWSVADYCGNTTLVYQHFLVDLPPITFQLEDTVNIYRLADLTGDMPLGGPSNVDALCGDIIQVSYSDSAETLSGCTGSLVRKWTMIDSNGDSVQASQTIVYQDTLQPVVEAPAPARVICRKDLQDLSITGQPQFVADDQSTISVQFTDRELDTLACYTQLLRTWMITDGCGNTAVVRQEIEHDARLVPEVNWPQAVARVSCRADAAKLALTGEPQLSFTCSEIKTTHRDIVVSSSTCETIIQRQWSVGSECGEALMYNQLVQIKDTLPPSFTAPAPALINVSDLGKLSATGIPTQIQDNCYTSNMLSYADRWIQEASCADTGLVLRTLMVTDPCGNVDSAHQEISILPLSTMVNVSLGIDTLRTTTDSSLLVLPVGDPPGGIFSGSYVERDIFQIDMAGVGIHEVIYTFTDSVGCSFSALLVIVVEAGNTTSTRQVDPDDQLLLWPNPAQAYVDIRFGDGNSGSAQLGLWSSTGRLVQKQHVFISAADPIHRLWLQDLPKGLYWLTYDQPGKATIYRKLIKH